MKTFEEIKLESLNSDEPPMYASDNLLVWGNQSHNSKMTMTMHRLTGPAYIDKFGESDWWIDGIHVSDKIEQFCIENEFDYKNPSEDCINMIKLYFGMNTKK